MNRQRWPTFSDPSTGIAYAESGRGPLFLLLHGLFDTSYTWHRLFSELAPDFHLVAPDLPGFGRTRLPDRWTESVSGVTRCLLKFLDRWKDETPVLAGSSMGGGLALSLAVSAPARFERLILLNPYGVPEIPVAVAAANRPLLAKLIPFLLSGPLRGYWARAVFSRSLDNRTEMTPAYLDELTRPMASFSRRRDLVRFLRGIDPDEMRRIDDALPGVRQEILLIRGENDRWLSSRHADRLEGRLPRCRRVNLPQCGHLPHLERPGETAKAIRGFLSGESVA
jgi:pimeloyl-ACP methyl ester carboxylesterase